MEQGVGVMALSKMYEPFALWDSEAVIGDKEAHINYNLSCLGEWCMGS